MTDVLTVKKDAETKILWTAFILLAAVLIALLVPMLYIGRYDVQCADDYGFGTAAHLAYKYTGSVWEALLAALRSVKETYYTWQGTFTAIFLFSFYPAVFDEAYYCLTPFILIGMLTLGNVLLCMTFFPKLFGMRKVSAGIVSVALMIILTQLVPSPVQSFYWYNGGVYYTFFHGLLLVLLAIIICDCVLPKLIWKVAGCFLAVFIGGGNYVTALLGFCVLVLGMAIQVLSHSDKWKRLVGPAAFLTAGLIISAAAPGNAFRAAGFADTPGIFETILLAFGSVPVTIRVLTSLPMAGLLLALIPVFWIEAGRSSREFRYPLAVSFLSVCLLAAMYCPPLYAMNIRGPARLFNIIFYTYVLLLLINIFYWCGYLRKKLRFSPDRRTAAGIICGILVLSGVMIGAGTKSYADYTSGEAVESLRSGEAWTYYMCAQERLITLRDDSRKDVELSRLWAWSNLLNFEEITEDPNSFQNISMAEYYEKDSVRLEAAEK